MVFVFFLVIVANIDSPPKWKISTDKVELVGCKYRSTINLNKYAYWLFNDTDGNTEKIEMDQTEIPIPSTTTPSIDGLMEFELPPLRVTSFKMIGDYRCVIENDLIKNQTKLVSEAARKIELSGSLLIVMYFYNVIGVALFVQVHFIELSAS